MVYNYKDIVKKYGSNYKINKALENKEIYKLDKGIYSEFEVADPLIIYSIKYPDAIITMDSALYFYNFTDVIPDKVYLATNKNRHVINDKDIFQIFVQNDKLNQGKVQVELNGNKINIYDKERLLVEFIRKKNSIPFDYYKEVINNYRKIAHELDMYKIDDYLSLYKYDVGIADTLQREVF